MIEKLTLCSAVVAAVLTCNSWTAAQALPSCQSLVEKCVQDCYTQRKFTDCPSNCGQKITSTPSGEKRFIWGQYTNGMMASRTRLSDQRLEKCS
jgi:hypothetical protein